MAQICKNRLEGIEVRSQFSGLPTSCFFDVIVIPLPTWLYLLAGYLVFIMVRRSREVKEDPALGRSPLLHRSIVALYIILTLVLLGVMSLVVFRLTEAQLGVGLIPFTFAGILFAAYVHFSTNRKMVRIRIFNFLYYLMLATALALSTSALDAEKKKRGRTGITKRYPLGNEIPDHVAMTIICIILAILELAG